MSLKSLLLVSIFVGSIYVGYLTMTALIAQDELRSVISEYPTKEELIKDRFKISTVNMPPGPTGMSFPIVEDLNGKYHVELYYDLVEHKCFIIESEGFNIKSIRLPGVYNKEKLKMLLNSLAICEE